MRIPALLTLLALFMSVAIAQDVVTVTPAAPTVGAALTISYHAGARGAILRSPKDLNAQLLAVGTDGMPTMVEVAMKKKDGSYSGTAVVTEGVSIYYLQFADGEKLDNNDERLWTILVHGSDGNPVAGALYSRGQSYLSGRALMLKFERDQEKGMADLREEVRLYPNAMGPRTLLWSATLRATPGDGTKDSVARELEDVYARVKDNEKDVIALLRTFEMTGQAERAAAIRTEWTTKNPKGAIAENDRWQKVYQERDPAKRFSLFEQANADFPPKESDRTSKDNQYVNFAILAGETDKALQRLAAMAKPSPDLYNTLAWNFIEKGERLPEATAWAGTGVELARHKDPSEKPPYFTHRAWENTWTTRLGMILDTYAYGLQQLDRAHDAVSAYAEAYKLLKGSDADVNARYVGALVGEKRYKEAMKVADECVRSGKSDDKLLEHYKTAHTAVTGSEKGFESRLSGSKRAARNDAAAKVKASMIDKPAPDFTLVSMDGKPVTLSKLRGKVVVVDFWATWCGPCKASFPYLQKVYDKYKDDPAIMILAVNTWENEKGEAREKTVRKFVADNKYTFPVVFDDNNSVVQAYGVEGIPTKFIIDRKGRIRFKDVGFAGGPEMMDKMEVQFEILRKD